MSTALAVLAAAALAWLLAARGATTRRLRSAVAGPPRAGSGPLVGSALRGRRDTAVLLAGVPVAAVSGGPVAGVLAAAVGIVALRRRRAAAQAAADAAERAGAVEACAALAAELRAGRAVGPALDAAAGVADGQCAEALRRAAATVALGGDVTDALRAPADAGAATALRRLAACLLVSARSGAGLAAAVAELADGLRAQERHRRELAAELAGPRATATTLAVLPVIGVGFGIALGADPLGFLLHQPLGVGCLAVALLLELAGLAWTDRLVSGALRALP